MNYGCPSILFDTESQGVGKRLITFAILIANGGFNCRSRYTVCNLCQLIACFTCMFVFSSENLFADDDHGRITLSSSESNVLDEHPLVAPFPEEAFIQHLKQPCSLGYNDFLLLINERVADELEIGVIQRNLMRSLTSQLGEELKMLKIELEDPKSKRKQEQQRLSNKQFSSIYRKYATLSLGILDKRQIGRLTQIKLHMANSSLYRNQMFQDYLYLSTTQITRIETIFRTEAIKYLPALLEEKRKERPNLRPLHSRINQKAFIAARDALEQYQLEKLDKIMGESPKFSNHEINLGITFQFKTAESHK